VETVAAFSPDALAQVRNELGLTQTGLGKLASMAKADVLRLEKGTVGISPARLVRIATALTIRPFVLLDHNAPVDLLTIRQEHGWGRVEFAEAAGISYQRLRRIEAGLIALPVDAALRIAQVLPFSPTQLIGFAKGPRHLKLMVHRAGTEIVSRWRPGQIRSAADLFAVSADHRGHPTRIALSIGLPASDVDAIDTGRFRLSPYQALLISSAYSWPDTTSRLEHFYGTNLFLPQLRQAAGLERANLAQQLRITTATLYRIETGERPIPKQLEWLWARLVGVTPEIVRSALANHGE
jgi:transcriptional regulator with XRE-family HTH domain